MLLSIRFKLLLEFGQGVIDVVGQMLKRDDEFGQCFLSGVRVASKRMRAGNGKQFQHRLCLRLNFCEMHRNEGLIFAKPRDLHHQGKVVFNVSLGAHNLLFFRMLRLPRPLDHLTARPPDYFLPFLKCFLRYCPV